MEHLVGLVIVGIIVMLIVYAGLYLILGLASCYMYLAYPFTMILWLIIAISAVSSLIVAVRNFIKAMRKPKNP